jgi:hypothetical protein
MTAIISYRYLANNQQTTIGSAKQRNSAMAINQTDASNENTKMQSVVTRNIQELALQNKELQQWPAITNWCLQVKHNNQQPTVTRNILQLALLNKKVSQRPAITNSCQQSKHNYASAINSDKKLTRIGPAKQRTTAMTSSHQLITSISNQQWQATYYKGNWLKGNENIRHQTKNKDNSTNTVSFVSTQKKFFFAFFWIQLLLLRNTCALY